LKPPGHENAIIENYVPIFRKGQYKVKIYNKSLLFNSIMTFFRSASWTRSFPLRFNKSVSERKKRKLRGRRRKNRRESPKIVTFEE